ncbi:NAD kinase 2, mitochondrial-like [Pecten maximus]|uniref:NAD kinase 2, mitochondrial-like n=1 Tax=Pecten maximus TaxID=6579 RepID=UPI00145829C5|nr:NAD kinase 2, mitochondrial-like [Pecten maximus]
MQPFNLASVLRRPGLLYKHLVQSFRNIQHDCTSFNIKRVALVSKMTRYEFLKSTYKDLSEGELKKHLDSIRSDYESLHQLHVNHYKCVDLIHRILKQHSIETRVVNRFQYNEEVVNWADLIVTAGGDGTYLLAASKIKVKDKPIIGINTDPKRSEGYLCLSKKQFPAENFGEAVKRILEGKFKWKWRHRIRVTMSGFHQNDEPVAIHDQQLLYPEYRFEEHIKEAESHFGEELEQRLHIQEMPPRVLPILALNEVFIGEALSARVSYYEIKRDEEPSMKQKSSGITICTGTGSTSWFFHINHLPIEAVKDILEITKRLTHCEVDLTDQKLMSKVASEFNNSLKFSPDEPRMAYTVRDPIVNGVFDAIRQQRGFATRIKINSRMWDGTLVIDGDSSFHFNDGAVATMEMLESDALLTITLD